MDRPLRPVTILSTGGTIAMAGERATPALDIEALLATIPQLADVPGLRARELLAMPGAHLSAADALAVARAALAETEAGRGVVDHARHGHARGDRGALRRAARGESNPSS